MSFLIALLLAQSVPPQSVRVTNSSGAMAVSVTAAGSSGTAALAIQGITGGVPVPITGAISVTGTGDTVSAGAPTTFSSNAVCTGQLLTAGEQSAGFELVAGTLAATLSPQCSAETTGSNWSAGQFSDVTGTKTNTLVVTNPNALTNLTVVCTGSTRRIQVCTTAYTSGTANGLANAVFLQAAAASSGGGGGTVTQGGAGSIAQSWFVEQTDGTNVIGTSAHPVRTDPTGSTTQPISGTVTIGAGSAVIGHVITDTGSTTAVTGTVTVSGTVAATQSGTWNITNISGTISLPTGAATAAKQPALGTAGTPSADVISIQGVTSMTPLTVSQSGSWTVAATQSGTWNITNISGTISLPTGASTETTLAKLPLAQGSTTSGQNGILAQCAVTTSAPTYTTAQTAPCSVDTAGNLRITGSITASNPSVSATGSAVPSSGTYIAGNKSGTLTGISLDSSGNLNVNVAAGGGSGGTSSSFGSAFPATGTAIGASDGVNMQGLQVESSSNKNLKVGIYSGANEVTVTSGGVLSAATLTVTGTPVTLNAACATGLTCAAGSTATVSIAGQNNGNVTFASGSTPLMTLVGDCSYDGGTTWILTGTPSTSGVLGFATAVNVASNTVVNPANTSYVLPINSAACLGATDLRVRAAAYTSGSVSATLRAVFNGGGGGGGGASSNVNISSYGGTTTSLGQKTSSASIPVVLPSDAVAQNTSGGPTTISVACSDANLNACASNSFARFTVTGQASAQVQFANSTLTCATARADYLGADGATWVLGGFFNDTSGNVTTSVAFSASSATVNYGLSTPPTVNTTQFQIRCATAITNTTAVSASAGLFGSPPAPYAFPASGAAISPMAIAAYPEHATGFSCNVDAASAETQCIGLSGAGLKYYVKTAVFTSNAAITVKLHSSTTAGNACATSPSLVVPTLYLGTNTGAPLQFPQGLPAAAANSALCCFFSGASGSCVISGYIAP